ncbi:hypothetical protein [Crateriforma conspicua]|uniref:Uncharacterized protein n=1 Tax=Crateriforma conspicua TaxID=2527996 RepID=A0A5C5YBJ2_9PLAN|nr:hypothetical protein [Crateriforma conspicua]QDV61457.1 hypothetical protein Mal65_05800 [Crateriforma conspicua]TWT72298.1 hypothetical protein Pan14r_46180 [Crateriforma conspicua]
MRSVHWDALRGAANGVPIGGGSVMLQVSSQTRGRPRLRNLRSGKKENVAGDRSMIARPDRQPRSSHRRGLIHLLVD